MSVIQVFATPDGSATVQYDSVARVYTFLSNGVEVSRNPPAAASIAASQLVANSVGNGQIATQVIQRNTVSIAVAATGSAVIFTTAEGKIFVPTALTFVVTAAATPSGTLSVSLGTNSSAYNNMLAITATTGLGALGSVVTIPLGPTATVTAAASTAIRINLTTALVSGTATVAVFLEGFYTT